jgi:hypothetical protein
MTLEQFRRGSKLSGRVGWAVVLAFLFGFTVCGAQSQQPLDTPKVQPDQQTERPLHQQDAGSLDQAPARVPEVRPLVGEPNGGPEAGYRGEGTEFWPAFFGYKLKITDTLIAAFTALLFSATWLLWRATKKLVQGAEDTSKRQLRAYVIAGAGDIQEIDNGFLLTATLKNTGQTPASNVRIGGESFPAEYPLAADRPHPHPKPSTDYGLTLGAGEEFHCAYRITGNPVEIADALKQVQAGKFGFWIQGHVIYDDCFGKSHETKFRFVYGGRIAGITKHLHADRQGNEAT